MRNDLISRNTLCAWLADIRLGDYAQAGCEKEYGLIDDILNSIEKQPAIDAQPVVRCGESVYWNRCPEIMPDGSLADWGYCAEFFVADSQIEVDTCESSFCSHGKRRK